MKVLFVGLGSIGQRHLRNLKILLGDDVDIYALRRKNADNLLIESGTAIKVDSLSYHYGFDTFYDVEEAFQIQPDIVFITNPSSLHIDISLFAAKKGCNLFIEKPLSNSIKNVYLLKKIVHEKNICAAVAYQSRFNPSNELIKNIISSNEFGEVLSAKFKWGTYLPNHHPYEDYKQSYASRKDLGGGVILGLSHEIDMARELFGMPCNIIAKENKDNSLNLEVEDDVEIKFCYKKNNSIFDVDIFLSYSQVNEERYFLVELLNATITNDLLTNDVTILDKRNGDSKSISFNHITRDDLFITELKSFLSNVSNKKRNFQSLDTGIETLELCLESLNALKKNV